MASILYLLIPSRTEALAVQDWGSIARPYALVSTEGVILQHGKKP